MTDPASLEKKHTSKHLAASWSSADAQDKMTQIRATCVENAEELLNAATTIAEQKGGNHIAYHLAALALEEVGKSSMIFMSSLRDPGDGERKSPVEWIEDHERKLFWAIFSLRMDGKNPTKSIQQAFDIAKHIHETRLATLYVNPANPGARENISDDDLQNLLRLTDAQINLEKLKKPREMSADDRANLNWFFAATEDPYLKTIVFSKGSFEKQAEFADDTIGWLRWLKDIIEQNNRANVELAKKEMDRRAPEGEEGYEDKWETTIRLKSWSHSIRQKPLTGWNSRVGKIKLFKGTGNSELLVKFVAPKKILAQHAWEFGWHNSFLLVTAINISTTGFFWWYLPAFVSTYADGVRDLENNAKVDFSRVPELKLNWGHLVLSENDLSNAMVVWGHIAQVSDPTLQAVYQRYFRALALMAKNDIFFQFEGNLLVEFQMVLKDALAAYGDWDGSDESYDAAVDVAFKLISTETEYVLAMHDLIGVAAMTMRGENKTRPVTLEDVAKLKICCDAFLIMKARAHMQREIETRKAADAAGPSNEDTNAAEVEEDAEPR